MMRNLWMTPLMLLCAIFFAGQAAAADAAAQEAQEKTVREFFKLTNFQQSYERSVQAVIENHVQSNPAIARFQPVLTSFFNKYLGWQTIEPSMVKLYAEMLTTGELRDLITFYSTPTGKKWSTAQTELALKGAELQKQLLQGHLGELQRMLGEEMQKLQSQPDSTPAAPEK